MRGVLRQNVPSMFHRRLLLLAVAAAVILLLLAMQTARLTTGAQHEQRRAMVERALQRPDLTPTVRGRIYDRKGRVLAEDKPGVDVVVSFRVMNGDWAFGRAVEAAKRDLGRETWSALDAVQREAIVQRHYLAPYDQQVEQLWATLAGLGGVELSDLTGRRDRVVRWVQRLVALATARKRSRRTAALSSDNKEVGWNDVYVEVAEELQSHAMLFDIPESTRSRIEYFTARAKQEQEAFEHATRHDSMTADTREHGVWLEVQPIHVKQRRYPWETRTFMLDRSTFPGPLQNDQPIEITVDGIGRHIVGQLRRVHDGDSFWNERPFKTQDENGEQIVDLGGYLPNDPVGRFGIERSMEPMLRGSRGRRVLHLDTGREENARPEAGRDVHLTIDIELQARIQAIMSQDPQVGLMSAQPWHGEDLPLGTPLNGAAVVLSLDNSEILAAVSVPGISLQELRENDRGIYSNHIDQPYVFRPVQYLYEPGSTNKPLVLAAAITDGLIGPDETIDTSLGRLWEHRENIYRDWRVKQGGQPFGIIDGVEAIKVSSNVFFGRIAQMYGEGPGFYRLVQWFSKFGFGRRAGVGMFEELPGLLPEQGSRITEEMAAYMSIGEGAMAATPLQVANAHATVARGGLFIPPTLIQDRSRPGGPREAGNLNLSPAARERALRGMDESANDIGGTTRGIRFGGGYEPNFTCPGVRVFAKSGTAQPPPLRSTLPDGRPDPNGQILRTGNHAWVVALLQPEGEPAPTIAVAVVVEFAGSGGRVAGPIVNQITYALKREGYLGNTLQVSSNSQPD
jgi:penicillin-binding protein 2